MIYLVNKSNVANCIYFQFIEKFKEIKDLTRQQVAQQQTSQAQQQHSPQINGNVVDENHSANQTPPPPSPGARQVLHHRSSSLSAVQVCLVHAISMHFFGHEMFLIQSTKLYFIILRHLIIYTDYKFSLVQYFCIQIRMRSTQLLSEGNNLIR